MPPRWKGDVHEVLELTQVDRFSGVGPGGLRADRAGEDPEIEGGLEDEVDVAGRPVSVPAQ